MNIKTKIKSALFDMKFYKLTSMQNQCYIINYHKVADEPNIFYPEISTQVFERQVKHLAKNYNILPLDELFDRIQKRKSLRGCVAVTFDDGFRDNYSIAYPILKKYNVPATIFLITDCIQTGEAPWFIKFRYAFETAKMEYVKIDLGDIKFDLPLNNLENKHKSSNRLMARLQTCSNKERIDYLAIVYDALEYSDPDDLPITMLTWDHIKEMAQNSISFGAHTHTHPILSSLSLIEAEQEIKISKQIIEANLGTKVNGFAYPVGKTIHFNKKVVPILKKYGFSYAVTTSGDKISYMSDSYKLSRPIPWELTLLKK